MAVSDTKLRMLYLMKILLERTDEENIMSSEDPVSYTHLFCEDEHILCLYGRIPDHGLIFFSGAAIIAFSVAAIAAKRVAVDIYRTVSPVRPWDIDHDYPVTVSVLNKYIFGGKYIYADFFWIVDHIPKLLDEFFRSRQVNGRQGLVFLLYDAEQDYPAHSVGKSRIGLPDTFRQSTQGFLGFYTVILPVCF